MVDERILVITDCEGPITLNDNAFELSSHFVPEGDRFFSQLSAFDDYLADIERMEDYKAGNTLALIIPFLLEYGLTDGEAVEFSHKNLAFVPEALEVYKKLAKISQVRLYIVSTSYECYIEAVLSKLDLSRERGFCTEVSFSDGCNRLFREPFKDGCDILRRFRFQIISAPKIELNNAKKFKDLSKGTKEAIRGFKEIFFEEMPRIADFLIWSVNPIGGPEKAKPIKVIVKKEKIPFSKTIYIGDSITDKEALALVRKKRGLAISFNGNRYALEEAEFAVISETAKPIKIIAKYFLEGGKEKVLKRRYELPELRKISENNFEEIVGKSEKMRQKVRGCVGKLG